MEPTLFFLFFLAGFVAILLGVYDRHVAFCITGAFILLALFFPIFNDGFTEYWPYDKNVTVSYNYYPIYNGTINMTKNMTTSTTIGYSLVTTKDQSTVLFSWAILFLGLGGFFTGVYYSLRPRDEIETD